MSYSFRACQWEQEESWSLSKTCTCKHTDTCLNPKAANETKPETFKVLGCKSYPERKKWAVKCYPNLRELDSKKRGAIWLTCLPPSLPLPSLLPQIFSSAVGAHRPTECSETNSPQGREIRILPSDGPDQKVACLFPISQHCANWGVGVCKKMQR